MYSKEWVKKRVQKERRASEMVNEIERYIQYQSLNLTV